LLLIALLRYRTGHGPRARRLVRRVRRVHLARADDHGRRRTGPAADDHAAPGRGAGVDHHGGPGDHDADHHHDPAADADHRPARTDHRADHRRARAAAGCGPLTTDARITRAAQGHSDDMAAQDFFDHDGLDGRGFADRIAAAGYPSPGAENIARGQRTPAAVVEAWLGSPGHRRNIEDCSLTTIGVGLATDGYYWTQDFGR
jgi:hypothetical protein